MTSALAPNAARAQSSFRERFGLDVAGRLMRSSDPAERLRGLQRVADTRTPEALGLLERAAIAGLGEVDARAPFEGVARTDPRALLVVVRALATWTERESARASLAAIIAAPTPSLASHVSGAPSRDPAADEADGAARVLLARQEAALALAGSGNALAIEGLIARARSGGPGQRPALEALATLPPAAPLVLGGVALTTPPMIALAAAVGDLRALDAVLGAVRTSDAGLRAAAIGALGLAGDTRCLEVARAAAEDPDARVRLAAASALVHLGAPDAARLVGALVTDDETALDALRLALDLQGDDITRAAAARAVASADRSVQAASVMVLGRQAGALAVRALATLVTHPALQSDAAFALARSPSPEAAATLFAMATNPAMRRLAARAYFVRRFDRDERSPVLDRMLETLAASPDPHDRAVGVQALVALGGFPLEQALSDRDPRVRRAAALGAFATVDTRTSDLLLSRMALERDDATRQLFGLGLVGGDPGAAVPTSTLLDLSGGGGTDAALATLALARRPDDAAQAKADMLLASWDPVIRAHAARGLGASGVPDAAGRLAQAYEWEADVDVRRAIVAALSASAQERTSGARRRTLELAARLDPDRLVRWTAERALLGEPPASRGPIREVAWLRLEPAEGAALPRDALGVLIRSDGVAIPVAFDDEGYALVPGVPPGEARLRLAPSLPAYIAPPP